MITPTQYEICCDAWDCKPDGWSPWSRPLMVEARSLREAAKKARKAGWRTCSTTTTRHWWCPRHAAAAESAKQRVGTGSITVAAVRP